MKKATKVKKRPSSKDPSFALDPFNYKNYKDFLGANLEKWGEVTRLAEAAGCQRSYISQVVHGSQQLTLDHAYGLSVYWKLAPAQKQYFLLLVQIERAASKEYRDDLLKELEKLKKLHQNISERLERKKTLMTDQEAMYFSSWHWVAIHHLTSLPDCNTVQDIATRLNLPHSIVEDCLRKLEALNLVRHEGNQWNHSFENLHIPKSSPLVHFHHHNWRQRALTAAQDVESSGLHFTDIRTLSRKDFEVIKNVLLEQIERIAEIAEPSDPETLVGFNLDFFEV